MNILYIFTDQHSAQALSCAGNADLHTPHLDALAARGLRFTDAYCSHPLCSPCRASMFTGLMPSQCGCDRNDCRIPAALQPRELGRLLAAAGYDCGYGGKWHLPDYGIQDAASHGFACLGGFGDDRLVERCAEFLGTPRTKPFFLVASFDNPHNICEWSRNQPLPWGSIEERDLDDCPLPPANAAIPPFEPEFLDSLRRSLPQVHAASRFGQEDWRRYRSAYYRLVEKADREIGRLLAVLDQLGLRDDTLVVFSSDHGDGEGSHAWNNKQVLYEESIRVPFIVAGPGVVRGGVCRQPVAQAIDLLPTLCDLAHIPAPEGLPGRSLAGILRGDCHGIERTHVVIETRHSGMPALWGRALRGERHKYVCYNMGRHREQLFDLRNDPGELVNLAVSARHADLLQQHREALLAWCDGISDRFRGQIPGVRDREIATTSCRDPLP